MAQLRNIMEVHLRTRFKSVALGVLLVVLGCSKAQLPTTPKTPEITTSLVVTAIDPTGQNVDSALVYVDGKLVGKTPYKAEKIEPGRHVIRITKEGFQTYRREIDIIEGEKFVLEAVLSPLPPAEGELVITSNQDSTLIKVKNSGGEVVAETYEREARFELAAGAYIVSGEKPGFYKVVKAVEVKSGESTVVNLELQPITQEPPPPTISLSADPDTIFAGQIVNLSWRSTNATTVTVDFVENASLNGQAQVQLNLPGKQEITATAIGPGGEARDTVYVQVLENTPPTLMFDVVEDSVQVGEEITLTWQTDGFQVVIDQGIGVRGPTGSERILMETAGMKVFTATAYGDGNLTTQKSDSVKVLPKSIQPPNLEFNVIPDTVEFGEPVPIEWNSDGFQVVIDQGVGVRGPTGYEEVQFANPGKKVFTATAYGQENLITIRKDSVFIKEAPEPLLPVVFLSTTRVVTVDSFATITWYTKNADFVVIDYVENPGPEGSVKVKFSTPGIRLVTATAFNSAGYTSVTDTIEVIEPEVQPVDDIIVPSNTAVRADKGEERMSDLNAASFEIQYAGKYKIFAEVWYNSGDTQVNESFYIQLRAENGEMKFPEDPNAGIYKVVPDDPGEPHTATRDCGTFKLDQGKYTIEFHHYAKIAAMYPQFINGSIDGPESVYIVGFKIVFITTK